MPKSKHSEAGIIAALQQLDAGRKASEVAREVGVSPYTIYAWKAKYGGRIIVTCPGFTHSKVQPISHRHRNP